MGDWSTRKNKNYGWKMRKRSASLLFLKHRQRLTQAKIMTVQQAKLYTVDSPGGKLWGKTQIKALDHQ